MRSRVLEIDCTEYRIIQIEFNPKDRHIVIVIIVVIVIVNWCLVVVVVIVGKMIESTGVIIIRIINSSCISLMGGLIYVVSVFINEERKGKEGWDLEGISVISLLKKNGSAIVLLRLVILMHLLLNQTKGREGK